jgi:hypothetical protein
MITHESGGCKQAVLRETERQYHWRAFDQHRESIHLACFTALSFASLVDSAAVRADDDAGKACTISVYV